MPDPLTTAILSAVGNAATKEIVSKTWDSGKKWLATFFADHQPEAQQAAKVNASAFVTALAARVEKLEERQPYNQEFFSQAFKQPSFSALLQKAIINSAQTKNTQKHALLSKLVTEKLQAKEETTLALASQMACDAIAFATPDQLQLLGLCSAMMRIPKFNLPSGTGREVFLGMCESYFQRSIQPFLGAKFNIYDILHLEALSCLKHANYAQIDLNTQLRNWGPPEFTLTQDDLYHFAVGQTIKKLWEQNLRHIVLTSVGMLVGSYVIDVTTGTEMNMAGWGQS